MHVLKCWPGTGCSFRLITVEQVDLWCLISSVRLTAMIKCLAVAAWWKHHIIKISSKELQRRAGRYFAKSTLLLHRISRQSPPLIKLSPLHATLHSSWNTYAHTHTHRCVCSWCFSQSAMSAITRGRCYSHNSLASSALTRRPVLLPSIMLRKLQFPHVSYRELWSALIEYYWYFPRYYYWTQSQDSFCGSLT